MLETVTLDQLRVLVAIADCGSFTAASKQLDRAQSAVSHAMATLELQLDLQLFDRSAKKPKLTPSGEKILSEARSVLVRASRLKSVATSLVSGLESEILIASDTIVPAKALFIALKDFSQEFPHIAVSLLREGIGAAPDYVIKGEAHIGFTGAMSLMGYKEDDFDRTSVGVANVLAIASPEHPLAKLNRPLLDKDLADYRQLLPSSRVKPRYDNTLVHDVWAIADLQLRYDMIVANVGWGTVPAILAEDDLRQGRVQALDIQARSTESMQIPLFAITQTSQSPGPATQWLTNRVGEALKTINC